MATAWRPGSRPIRWRTRVSVPNCAPRPTQGLVSPPTARPAWPRSTGRAARGLSRSATPRSRSSSGKRRLVVECQDDVALGGRDLVRRADRLAALRDTRDQGHVAREGHARQAAAPDAVGEVHRAGARRRQAAEEVAAGRAVAHLADQLGQVGGRRVGVHQGGEGLDAAERAHAREDLEASAPGCRPAASTGPARRSTRRRWRPRRCPRSRPRRPAASAAATRQTAHRRAARRRR